jgi:hypothetical protein
MKSTPAVFALGVLLVSAMVLGAAQTGEIDSIRFDHAIHAENDVECTDCHANATTSVSGADLLLPVMDDCSSCHDIEDESLCGTCHTHVEDPLSYPPRAELVQKFSHAAHVGRDMDCASCHGAAKGGEPHAAIKADCRVCHTTAADFADCAQCHAASEPRVPMDHSAEWASTHGIEAGWNSASCANCHAQSDCQDCHSGDNVRPRAHPTDFAFDHALAARSNELECGTCHGESQFCRDCHASAQVLPQAHSRADWLVGADGGRHAFEGRLDIESCAACHDAGIVDPACAQCHGG